MYLSCWAELLYICMHNLTRFWVGKQYRHLQRKPNFSIHALAWLNSRNAPVGRRRGRHDTERDSRWTDKPAYVDLRSLQHVGVSYSSVTEQKRGGAGPRKLVGFRFYRAVISMPLQPRGSDFFFISLLMKSYCLQLGVNKGVDKLWY